MFLLVKTMNRWYTEFTGTIPQPKTSSEAAMSDYVYDAFISYSHRDLKWARWLQHRLETFRIPRDLCEKDTPRTHLKVFRDQTDLSGVELQNALQRELEASRFLIVICSPFSAASPWVNDEIRSFQTRGRSAYIIPFIVDGEPESDKPELECFPPALRSVEGEHPLGANAVEIGKSKAFLKLMAVILDVRFNRLVDREKQRRRKTRRRFPHGLFLPASSRSCPVEGRFQLITTSAPRQTHLPETISRPAFGTAYGSRLRR